MLSKHKRQLLSDLNELYPNPRSELNFSNPFQLLIAVMLSAQCTDKKVNEITPSLFKKYPDFRQLAKASLGDVEKIIRPINYYRTKAKNIVAAAAAVVERHGGKVPADHDELTSLPGVGRKTANVILCEHGKTPAFPVDTHVYRVARRLGLSDGNEPHDVEEDLTKAFPPEYWRPLHHQLIFHGRRVCKARNPLCEQCKLAHICPSAFKAKEK
jgi:endonuclease-3